MAIQTYVKRNNAYTAAITFSGADADQVTGQYEVFISLIHEWGTPVFNHSRLTERAEIGDTTIVVDDGTQFAVGDKIVFLGGSVESKAITAIDTDTITVSALTKNHNPGIWISVEKRATRTAANNYSYALTASDLVSSGQHKTKWRYVQSGVSTYVDAFINIYQPYIDSGTFFEIYPDLEVDFEEAFNNQERVVRQLINTYCGQTFDFYSGRALVFDGTGRNNIHTTTRLDSFETVKLVDDYSDITELVEKDPASDFYIRLVNKSSVWGINSEFEITGNWGWGQVPDQVSQAATILISDQFNDDTKLPKHGVVESYMDTHRLRFDSIILGTTGNLDADTLLLDYVQFTIGQI